MILKYLFWIRRKQGLGFGKSFLMIGAMIHYADLRLSPDAQSHRLGLKWVRLQWKDNIITHLKLAEAQTVSDNVAFHLCYDHKKVISGHHLKSDDTTTPYNPPMTEEITQHRSGQFRRIKIVQKLFQLPWQLLTYHCSEYPRPEPWVRVPDLTQF